MATQLSSKLNILITGDRNYTDTKVVTTLLKNYQKI